jgi:hypothetical protein
MIFNDTPYNQQELETVDIKGFGNIVGHTNTLHLTRKAHLITGRSGVRVPDGPSENAAAVEFVAFFAILFEMLYN